MRRWLVVLVAVVLLGAGCDRPPFHFPLPGMPNPKPGDDIIAKPIEGPRTCPKLPPGFACASGEP